MYRIKHYKKIIVLENDEPIHIRKKKINNANELK